MDAGLDLSWEIAIPGPSCGAQVADDSVPSAATNCVNRQQRSLCLVGVQVEEGKANFLELAFASIHPVRASIGQPPRGSPSRICIRLQMSAVQQVVEALNVLYQNPDKVAKESANAWLSQFQTSVSSVALPYCRRVDRNGWDAEAHADSASNHYRMKHGQQLS